MRPATTISVLALSILALGKAHGQVTPPEPVGKASDALVIAEMDHDIKDLRFEDLEDHLSKHPGIVLHKYFRGVLANRSGRIEESVNLLEAALHELPAEEKRRHASALSTLSDDYLKLFRYKDAAKSYQTILDDYSSQVDPDALSSIKDDLGLIRLIANYPPQEITRSGPILIKTTRSKIGTLDGTLSAGGVPSNWILDTGANFSVVTETLAKRLGITPSEGAALTKGGVSGLPNTIHTGLLPELSVGGATVRNVVVLIFRDKDLFITLGPSLSYQIDGILGYPVFESFGTATFFANGSFSGDPPAANGSASSRLFMNKMDPLVEGTIEGRKLLFAFDTGANVSQLTQRYIKAFPEQFESLKPVQVETGGAGGSKSSSVYVLPQVNMRIGGQNVTLHNIPALPTAMGTEIDETYGNLGRDVPAGFDSFTLDFKEMLFTLGPPLKPAN